MNHDLAWVAPYLRDGLPVDGAGNYNRNYIVPRGDQTVVVRVPIPGAAGLDFRAIPETAVLQAAEAGGVDAPRLLHADPNGRFAIHSFIPGARLDRLYPVRAPLPDWPARDLAAQLARLHALDPAPLSPHCADLPASPHSAALHRMVVAFTERVFVPLAEHYAWLYQRLGVPSRPLDVIYADARGLAPAAFTICHCDVHRRNLIVDPAAERLTMIDWELALVADPALDIAIHLHRMRYQPHQEELFLGAYLARRSEPEADVMARVAIYRRHEQVRSALIDAARTVDDVREDLPHETRLMLMRHYAIKLGKAWQIWGAPGDAALLDPEALLCVFEEAAHRAPSALRRELR